MTFRILPETAIASILNGVYFPWLLLLHPIQTHVCQWKGNFRYGIGSIFSFNSTKQPFTNSDSLTTLQNSGIAVVIFYPFDTECSVLPDAVGAERPNNGAELLINPFTRGNRNKIFIPVSLDELTRFPICRLRAAFPGSCDVIMKLVPVRVTCWRWWKNVRFSPPLAGAHFLREDHNKKALKHFLLNPVTTDKMLALKGFLSAHNCGKHRGNGPTTS